MMNENLFAYTETGSLNPGYVSINRDPLGKITVTIRAPGSHLTSDLELPKDEFEKMAGDVMRAQWPKPRWMLYALLDAERQRQDRLWGHNVDDTQNTPWMWTSYICGYATNWMKGTFLPLDKAVVDGFRECLFKTAALCVAAIESLDRQREKNGAAFYEKKDV